MDSGGSGLFGSSRYRNGVSVPGAHKGIDFLSFEGQETFAPITGYIRKTTAGRNTPGMIGYFIKGTGEYEGVMCKVLYTTLEFRPDVKPDDKVTFALKQPVTRGERIGLALNGFKLKLTSVTRSLCIIVPTFSACSFICSISQGPCTTSAKPG